MTVSSRDSLWSVVPVAERRVADRYFRTEAEPIVVARAFQFLWRSPLERYVDGSNLVRRSKAGARYNVCGFNARSEIVKDIGELQVFHAFDQFFRSLSINGPHQRRMAVGPLGAEIVGNHVDSHGRRRGQRHVRVQHRVY